jgi:hypothetical protein
MCKLFLARACSKTNNNIKQFSGCVCAQKVCVSCRDFVIVCDRRFIPCERSW